MTQAVVPTLQNSKTPATMCTEKGCTNVAAFSYVWPWGEAGACCHNHRLHVQQRCTSLDRGTMNFTAIDPHYVAPITRDERTQLIASRMTAEEDLKAALARGAELYNENTRLAAEVRRFRAREAEMTAQLDDAKSTIDRVIQERDGARADAGEAQLEVERLKAILPREEP